MPESVGLEPSDRVADEAATVEANTAAPAMDAPTTCCHLMRPSENRPAVRCIACLLIVSSPVGSHRLLVRRAITRSIAGQSGDRRRGDHQHGSAGDQRNLQRKVDKRYEPGRSN